MPIPSGVNKQVIYSKESTWGVAPLANSGKYIRRVSLDLNLTRDSFESAEISSTAQTSDMRLGSDNVEGTLSAELSPGSYSDLFAALLRGAWSAVVTTTGTNISATATTNILNLATGSWITLGFRVGDLVTVTGFTAPATANNVTAIITGLTAADMTLDATLITKIAGDSVTVATAGKKLATPLSPASRTNDSFTFEQWFDNISVSRVSTGVKVNSASISIQPNAMATVEFGLVGKDMSSDGTAYFTTPASASVTSVLSGSSGALFVDNVKVATLTGLSLEITGNTEAGVVIGSRNPADIFLGRITASGEFSAYFADDSLFTKFANEEACSLVVRLQGDGDDNLVIKLPKIKLGGSSVDDKEVGGLIQNIPFTALLNDGTVTSVEQSTVVLLDSNA